MNKRSTRDALVSICITSYNYGRYLRDAVESALGQTYPNIEVVVSDNGSSDMTLDVLAHYLHDHRVRIFVNESNVGLCKNHNLAIRRSRGSYIVLLSADDILFPEHVEHLMHRMQDPLDSVQIVSGQGILLSEHLEPLAPLLALGNLPIAYSHRDDLGNIMQMYYHMYPAKLVARSVYDQVGLFDERIRRSIDFEICARFEAANIPSAFIPELVAGMRMHSHHFGGQHPHIDAYSGKDAYNDRLYTYEHALNPTNAWRLEGYAATILHVARNDFQKLIESEEPVDTQLHQRFFAVESALSRLQDTTPQWPATEPQLSVVLLSEGYISLLKATLDHLALQQLERLEVVIVQTSGYDVQPLIRRLSYVCTIRVVQVRSCGSPAEAYRFGLEVARGEYVTYLAEGQLIGSELYATCIEYTKTSDAQMLLFPKSSVDDFSAFCMKPEARHHRFGDPAMRARERIAKDGFTFSEFMHRRALLRPASRFYEAMATQCEEVFLTNMAAHHRTVTLT